jgi:hypothetical protein
MLGTWQAVDFLCNRSKRNCLPWASIRRHGFGLPAFTCPALIQGRCPNVNELIEIAGRAVLASLVSPEFVRPPGWLPGALGTLHAGAIASGESLLDLVRVRT